MIERASLLVKQAADDLMKQYFAVFVRGVVDNDQEALKRFMGAIALLDNCENMAQQTITAALKIRGGSNEQGK